MIRYQPRMKFYFVSIRSPHRSKGRLLQVRPTVSSMLVSIRSPHRSKGRHLEIIAYLEPLTFVSIRSPHRSKGRHELEPDKKLQSGFNPLPSPKQGETSRSLCCQVNHLRFQSAPLTEARGDYKAFSGLALTYNAVSIRSPHRSKGRRIIVTRPCATIANLFQSAPLTEARGDTLSGVRAAGTNCFNPLPSPKQGETAIRIRHQSLTFLFQSAPLTEARGDCSWVAPS